MRQQRVETKTADKSVPQEIAALLSSERLILRETRRAVTPFGGVAVFVSFLVKIDLVGQRARGNRVDDNGRGCRRWGAATLRRGAMFSS